MPLMKCTRAIIFKKNELELSDKESKEVMQLLHDIQSLNRKQTQFFSFAFGEIVEEIAENVQ